MKHAAALTVAALLLAAPAHAQIHFEVEAGGGYTLVDVAGVADADGAIAQEWSQPGYRFSGRALFGAGEGMRFGAEVAHQYLYWYRVNIPFGSTPIRREYDVTATSAMGLVRIGSSGAAMLDLGAGVAFLDDPVAVASVAVGWEILPRLAVKLRADGFVASQPTVPIGLAFSYGFGPG